MTITLRTTDQTGATNKGSTLTHAELDGNFVDLLTSKIQAIQVDADSTNATVGVAQGTGVLEIKGGTNITTAIAADSAGTAILTITGITDVVSDTSPQLGGNLDTNGQNIVTTSNGNIKLYPNGSGVVEIGGGGGSDDGTIQLNCSANSHGIKLASPPHSAGQSYTLTFPSTSPNANDFIVTNADGDLSFVKLSAGTGITITNPDSAGDFVITNTLSAGIASVANDSSPQLGGNLDVNGNDIVSVSNGNIDIQPNGSGKTNLKNITYNEKIHEVSHNSNFTPEPTDGPIQRMVMTGAVNFNGFATETEGATISIIFEQDGSGNHTFTDNVDSANRMLFAGGEKTLSTAANSIDIMTITFASGTYFASLSKNFSA
jgi:hypothetical protein